MKRKMMRTACKTLRSELGMVLYTSLLILSLLVTVGLGARVMLRTDFQILANLRSNTEALYLAEAGIEWGKDQILQSFTHPPSPASRAQEFLSGRFSVEFKLPTLVTPLAAKVPLSATGVIGNSSRVIEAQVTKSYDLSDGAVSLRGNAGRLIFGDSFFISGLDHDPATAQAIATTKSRPAIATSDETVLTLVTQTIADNAQTGRLETGEESPAMSRSGFIPGPRVSSLANDLCSSALAVRAFLPAPGTLSLENQSWGTRTSPQLRCFEGLDGSGDMVNLVGVTGAGILVIRNADLVVSGSFHWEGWIIVTGSNVGFKSSGADTKEVLGGLMVNEISTPDSVTAMLELQGSIRVLFSRLALNAAASLIPAATLQSAYSSLPPMVSQDYWRTVGP